MSGGGEDRMEEFRKILYEKKFGEEDIGFGGLRNRMVVKKGSTKVDSKEAGNESVQSALPCTNILAEAKELNANIQSTFLLIGNTQIESSLEKVQKILDLFAVSITVLEEKAQECRVERQGERSQNLSWYSSLWSDEGGHLLEDLDRHEAGIIWFLRHQISLLTKRIEALIARDLAEMAKKRQIGKLCDDNVFKRRRLPVYFPNNQNKKSVSDFSNETVLGGLDDSTFAVQYGLDADQLKVLAQENDGLLEEYNEMQEKVEETAASIQEISRLQGTLQEQLIHQSSQVNRIFDDAVLISETLEQANKQLVKAGKGQSGSVKMFLCFMLFATIMLLIFHFCSA